MRMLVGLLAGILLPGIATAGVYLENTYQNLGGEKKAPEVHKMWFDGGRLRAEPGKDRVTIFKNDAVYVLDTRDRTYMTLEKAKLDQLGAQLADARKKMEAQLADMPPERRAMMEKMMGQMGAGAVAGATKKRSVSKTARTEKTAGHTCTVWDVNVEGTKVQELCVVPAGSLAGGNEVMQTARELGEMLESLADLPGGGGIREVWSDLQSMNGIPVMTREFEGGKVTAESRLTTIRSESPAAGAFDIPAGYTEKKMPLGGR